MWDDRNDETSTRMFPVWELAIGPYWQESLVEWQVRWRSCGGEIFKSRMMASKWSPIWGKLASSFSDGFGKPYPPYARNTCVYLRCICDDEAIVLGVLSENEFKTRIAEISAPKKPLLDRNGQPLDLRKLLGDEYDNFVARGQMSRQDRLAEKKERKRVAAEKSAAYRRDHDARVEKERKDKNETFRQLERIDSQLETASSEEIERDSEDLLNSLNGLAESEHFERYPKWSARAWKYAGMVHRILGHDRSELEALRNALAKDSKVGVKRRLGTLERKLLG